MELFVGFERRSFRASIYCYHQIPLTQLAGVCRGLWAGLGIHQLTWTALSLGGWEMTIQGWLRCPG